MDSSRRTEVTRGVVLPLVVLVVVFALGVATGNHLVFAAMLAAIPMFAAVSAGLAFTALVAVVAVAASVGLTLMAPEIVTGDWAAVGGVLVFGVLALLMSRMRPAAADAAAAPSERRKSTQFQMQTQADIDSMTGLLNRRGAIRVLGSRNGEGERVVAFLDCDLFKDVNREYGSEVGDEFLQAVAGRLRHRLPGHDTVARWDGDEFLLAITASAADARPALERVVSMINANPIRTVAGPIPATVSVGAAVWAPGQELEDVIARSGRALYSAKVGGRGRIVLDGEDGPSSAPDPGSVPEAAQAQDEAAGN